MAKIIYCDSEKPVNERIIKKMRSKFGSVYVRHLDVAWSDDLGRYACVNCGRTLGSRDA